VVPQACNYATYSKLSSHLTPCAGVHCHSDQHTWTANTSRIQGRHISLQLIILCSANGVNHMTVKVNASTHGDKRQCQLLAATKTSRVTNVVACLAVHFTFDTTHM
jgi:hypothetical protein